MSGKFWFVCPNPQCEGPVTIEDEFDPPWPDLLAETAHDSESQEIIPVICPICDAQYDVEVVASLAGYEAHLANDPSIDVQVRVTDEDFDTDADHWDVPPPEPVSVYEEADRELRAFLSDLAMRRVVAGSSLPRMGFVHLFSMIEAYLADTIIGLCDRDDEVRLRVVKDLKELNEVTYTLAQIEEGEDLVRNSVRSHLRMRQFHKLAFVDELYQIGIRTRILPREKTERDLLFAAVAMRHDCVHRNGRDPSGNIHNIEVTKVLELAGRFMSIVRRVQSTVDQIDEAREALAHKREALPFDDDLPF